MKAVQFQITLLEPAICTALEGEPNSAVSYDFIPGSVLRGLFISKIHSQTNNAFDPLDADNNRRFFSNETRFMNAYPLIQGERSIPVPASWKRPKYPENNSEEVGSNFTISDEALSERSIDEDTSPKPKSKSVGGFTTVTTNPAVVYKVERVLNVHTQRARSERTAQTEAGKQRVYRYDSIASGQTFSGIILCQNDEDADYFADLLNSLKRIHIGGARSAGYGLAQLDNVELLPEWHETSEAPVGDAIIITLTSDLILKDAVGQYRPTLASLKQAFAGHGIDLVADEDTALNTTLVGGFNRKWGMPLPQTEAIKRGSVIRLAHPVDTTAIQSILDEGIGERCNEGFGQVVFGWQTASNVDAQKYSADLSLPTEAFTSSQLVDSQLMLGLLVHRMEVTVTAEEFAAAVFTDDAYRIRGNISPSQLSRLRLLIADELRTSVPSMNFITEFVKDVTGRKDAERRGDDIARIKAGGKQFERARIGEKSLLEWIQEPQFNFDGYDEMSISLQLKLLDAVLERAHKERMVSQQGGAKWN